MSGTVGRPAYGEYATPEQVARARGMSLAEYEKHLAEIARPAASGTDSDAASAAASKPRAVTPAVAPATPRATPAPGSRVNRVVTTALLAFGLACTLLSIPGLLSLGQGLSSAFEAQGLGTFTAYQEARVIGTIAIVVQLLLWVLTLALSLAALRRGRTSWWIPLVAGAVAVVLVAVLWFIVITVDPAFMAYVNEVMGQS